MTSGVYKRTNKHIEINKESHKGHKHTKQHKKNISNAVKGKKNPFYGKFHSDKTKEQISIKNKGKNKPLTAHKFPKGKNHPNWKDGKSFEIYPREFNKELREYIRQKYKYKCQICNKLQIKRKLSVHHIDYNKQNYDEANLILLCNRCHSFTNNNRKEWQQYFKDKKNKILIIGYNLKNGSKGYGWLNDYKYQNNIIETPVNESLMFGLATGLAIEKYRPILFIERFDFIFNCLDGIINHLDKDYQYPIAIKIIIGDKKPIDAGVQHTQNYTKELKSMCKNIVVIESKSLGESQKIMNKYWKLKKPVIIIEKRSIYRK